MKEKTVLEELMTLRARVKELEAENQKLKAVMEVVDAYYASFQELKKFALTTQGRDELEVDGGDDGETEELTVEDLSLVIRDYRAVIYAFNLVSGAGHLVGREIALSRLTKYSIWDLSRAEGFGPGAAYALQEALQEVGFRMHEEQDPKLRKSEELMLKIGEAGATLVTEIGLPIEISRMLTSNKIKTVRMLTDLSQNKLLWKCDNNVGIVKIVIECLNAAGFSLLAKKFEK